MLTPWQFGSCGWILLAKIFEITLGRKFEPRLGKFLELARIYHKHSPHEPNCHGVIVYVVSAIRACDLLTKVRITYVLMTQS